MLTIFKSLKDNQMNEIKQVYQQSQSAQTFLSDYNPEDVGVVILPHYSGSIWTIPPPEEKDLESELKKCEFILFRESTF